MLNEKPYVQNLNNLIAAKGYVRVAIFLLMLHFHAIKFYTARISRRI